jgi:hypothetical protein
MNAPGPLAPPAVPQIAAEATLSLVWRIMSYFSGGMIMSAMEMLMPPRMAHLKPVSLIRSRSWPVFSLPAMRK